MLIKDVQGCRDSILTYLLSKKINIPDTGGPSKDNYLLSNDVFKLNFVDNYLILHSSTRLHIDLIAAIVRALTTTNIENVERLRISTINEIC